MNKRRLIIFCIVIVGILSACGQQKNKTILTEEDTTERISSKSNASTDADKSDFDSRQEFTSTKEIWYAGQYKCGTDIEPGIYMIFATGGSGYYSITTDANGDDIVANDNFNNNQIIEISAGQYLELSRAYAMKYHEAPEALLIPKSGILPEGRYKVGQHIPAGEYKVRATSNVSGYYSLTSDPNGENIISNDNFDGERYVAIKDGQYLELTRCQLIVPQSQLKATVESSTEEEKTGDVKEFLAGKWEWQGDYQTGTVVEVSSNADDTIGIVKIVGLDEIEYQIKEGDMYWKNFKFINEHSFTCQNLCKTRNGTVVYVTASGNIDYENETLYMHLTAPSPYNMVNADRTWKRYSKE